MSRTRHTLAPGDEREPRVRSLAVTFPKGGAIEGQVSDWGRLVYASRGAMRVRTAQGEWLLPPGRALFVPAGIRHRVEMTGTVSLRTLYFLPALCRRLPRECRVLKVSALLRELILHVSRRAAADPYLATESRAIALLLEQLREGDPVPLRLPQPVDPRAVRAARLLGTPAGSRMALAVLGRKAGASARTLQRLFLAETGLTFEKWRQRARLARAVELLAGGPKVTNVALEVGYDSPSAFVAMFRRELGSTPRAYLRGASKAEADRRR